MSDLKFTDDDLKLIKAQFVPMDGCECFWCVTIKPLVARLEKSEQAVKRAVMCPKAPNEDTEFMMWFNDWFKSCGR